MITCAVTSGNKKLRANVTAEINNAYPLISRENALIALGSLAACCAVKIVVCFGCPSTGNSYPNGAKLLCKSANLCVVEIDWRIVLHKTCESCMICEAIDLRKFFSTCDLAFGISLPERTTGNLSHLYVVGHKTGVEVTDGSKALVYKFNKMCHWF